MCFGESIANCGHWTRWFLMRAGKGNLATPFLELMDTCSSFWSISRFFPPLYSLSINPLTVMVFIPSRMRRWGKTPQSHKPLQRHYTDPTVSQIGCNGTFNICYLFCQSLVYFRETHGWFHLREGPHFPFVLVCKAHYYRGLALPRGWRWKDSAAP